MLREQSGIPLSFNMASARSGIPDKGLTSCVPQDTPLSGMTVLGSYVNPIAALAEMTAVECGTIEG
jgi:hypothetical protein